MRPGGGVGSERERMSKIEVLMDYGTPYVQMADYNRMKAHLQGELDAALARAETAEADTADAVAAAMSDVVIALGHDPRAFDVAMLETVAVGIIEMIQERLAELEQRDARIEKRREKVTGNRKPASPNRKPML